MAPKYGLTFPLEEQRIDVVARGQIAIQRHPAMAIRSNRRYIRIMQESSNGMPQFATAEFAPNSPTLTCAACKAPISADHFRIGSACVCPECARKIQAQNPADSHAAFVRAVMFGVAGAVAGLAVYVIFAIATGLVIGWVSVAVGFIIGKAMHFGSRGVGGRRYQITAALLTYLAVSMAAVPIAIHQMGQHRPQVQSSETTVPPPSAPMNIPKIIGVLALLGIASPLLDLRDPVHGLIGLVILFVGIRFAWRFTAGRTVEVSGPYDASPTGLI